MGSSGWTADPDADQVTWPYGAATGQTRIVAGADTPAELASYGVKQALLFYVVDPSSNLEIGYFFIGNGGAGGLGKSNQLWIGTTRYPVPGVPSSATAVNVDQLFQYTLNTIADDPLIQDLLRLSGDTTTLETGQPFLHGQTGVETFTTGVAVSSATVAVVFNVPFNTPPSVSANIDNGAGLLARWACRAIGIGVNGFTMFIFKGDGADPAVILPGVNVTWIAANAGV